MRLAAFVHLDLELRMSGREPFDEPVERRRLGAGEQRSGACAAPRAGASTTANATSAKSSPPATASPSARPSQSPRLIARPFELDVARGARDLARRDSRRGGGHLLGVLGGVRVCRRTRRALRARPGSTPSARPRPASPACSAACSAASRTFELFGRTIASSASSSSSAATSSAVDGFAVCPPATTRIVPTRLGERLEETAGSPPPRRPRRPRSLRARRRDERQSPLPLAPAARACWRSRLPRSCPRQCRAIARSRARRCGRAP